MIFFGFLYHTDFIWTLSDFVLPERVGTTISLHFIFIYIFTNISRQKIPRSTVFPPYFHGGTAKCTPISSFTRMTHALVILSSIWSSRKESRCPWCVTPCAIFIRPWHRFCRSVSQRCPSTFGLREYLLRLAFWSIPTPYRFPESSSGKVGQLLDASTVIFYLLPFK